MKATIVMQTDFTKDSPAVCTMYGVSRMVDNELDIFDNTHSIPKFDTYQASDALISVVEFWSPGTVFVSVVDPTVGTDRKACVAKLVNGSYVVTPDNGSLTHLKKYFGIDEVRIIDEKTNRYRATSKVSIFHGRDLFAYCAAKLASGKISYEEVGPKYHVDEIIEHEIAEPYIEGDRLVGMIANLDPHFGLVASNIPCDSFEREGISIEDELEVIITHSGEELYKEIVPFQPSFGYVAIGEPVVVISENQMMQIAINQRNFIEIYGIDCGPEWMISFRKIKR